MSQREEKKRKRKCVFHSEYSEEFKFIKPGKTVMKPLVNCVILHLLLALDEVQSFELHL